MAEGQGSQPARPSIVAGEKEKIHIFHANVKQKPSILEPKVWTLHVTRQIVRCVAEATSPDPTVTCVSPQPEGSSSATEACCARVIYLACKNHAKYHQPTQARLVEHAHDCEPVVALLLHAYRNQHEN